MSQQNDGGLAFPACNEASVNGTVGMSMRDYFAAAALSGMGWVCPTEAAYASKAKQAYEIADAMLKERAKG